MGGALTDFLMESRHNIRVYDNLLYEEAYRKPVDFVYGDVRDTGKLKPHVAWADVVVWLAAIVGDPACAIDPSFTSEINTQSVDWLVNNFDGRILFTSTCSVYGANNDILDESGDVNPLSEYAVSKLEAESHLANSQAMVFRLGTLFGIGDNYSRMRLDLVINYMTAKAHSERQISVFGGEQYRPFLHVKDVAQAIKENLETNHTGIFNLHQCNIAIRDLAEEIRQHYPDLRIEHTEIMFEDQRNYRISSEKIATTCGFRALRTINDGIAEIGIMLREGRLKDIMNPRYSNANFLKLSMDGAH